MVLMNDGGLSCKASTIDYLIIDLGGCDDKDDPWLKYQISDASYRLSNIK
jgi:hypothetical protein